MQQGGLLKHKGTVRISNLKVNKIDYIIINGQRVELPTDWRVLAKDLGYKGDDMTLLSKHFNGESTLLQDLSKVSKDLTTNWHKIKDHAKSSLVRIYRGKVQYKTYQNKYIKPQIKVRSSKDKHINSYYCYSNKVYLHKAAAYVVAKERGFDGFYNDFDMIAHHRRIGETETIKGNSLDNLTVLTGEDHLRLHSILKRISKNIKCGSLQMELL